MAEKETKNNPKDMIEAVPEETEVLEKLVETQLEREKRLEHERVKFSLDSWTPKTKLGIDVRAGKEKDIDKILKTGKKILEPEIVDKLLSLESDLLLIGQEI